MDDPALMCTDGGNGSGDGGGGGGIVIFYSAFSVSMLFVGVYEYICR